MRLMMIGVVLKDLSVVVVFVVVVVAAAAAVIEKD